MKNKKAFIIGKKVGMTQVVDENGVIVPVTVINVLENEVVGFRTVEKDGYQAVRIGYEKINSKKNTKPNNGQFKGDSNYRYIKEFRVAKLDDYEINKPITLDSFECGSKYDAQSKTIGRGYTGTVKAWNFAIGPMAHGSKSHRRPGSIGQATYPGEVAKGKKMYTRYGNENVTIQNLELISKDDGVILLKGAVPGKQGYVFITDGDQ